MDGLLHAILVRNPMNLFDEFQAECLKWYESPAHSFVEMRARDNKKVRGDIFEEFCVLYLKHIRRFPNVWRLADVPEEHLTKLGLKRPDVGIDIIAESGGKFYAVQCKYKKHVSMKRNMVTWKSLSTFYALCLRTGPWEKMIVMTNCDCVRHMGKKSSKDVSICLGTLRKITAGQWMEMCEMSGQRLCEMSGQRLVEKAKKPSLEELRALRIAALEKKTETLNQ
jgi:hypothetical protein